MKNLLSSSTRDNTLTSMLYFLKVKHTKSYANKHFNEHPHKYNMLGLSKMLSHFGVENLGVKANDKEEDILALETPYIAHIGSDFVTVYKVTESEISFIRDGKEITVSLEEYLKIWSGVVLLAETNENSMEPEYKKNRKSEFLGRIQKMLLILAIAVLSIILLIHNDIYHNIGLILLLILCVIGVYIGYLLVIKQLNIHSNYADKICSLFSKSDCNDVLDSPAAKFMGIISWSELGLSYFTSNIILILFAPSLLSFLVIINICAIPYSFWSIWYQKFKLKQWCPLCLVVQVLFGALFIVNLTYGFVQIPDFTIISFLSVGTIYAIPFFTINLVLPKFTEERKIERITQEFNSFRINENVFLPLLRDQPRYELNKNTSRILFGNPESKNLLTIFTNPHCEPCARMHMRVENLLSEVENNFCIQYVLTSFNTDLDSSSEFLIYINNNKSIEERNKIYHEWFRGGKYKKEEFFRKYKFTYKSVSEEYKQHKIWKEQAKLMATPIIILNGFELPKNYNIEDLKYLII
ncbi:vitamin K epoxide reductase family protein [Dysgonomonas sp. ZJ709]|uniref:vitamin K epoxide reductase family protein n=1 Tax=Dysgonomonas sp. ZJ709 TaxID=2709797 RepID=UPI0013EBA745|nr:vitamin K epoxide reductase family protein [Dysgonomonas sp. ZJ709]